LFERGELVTPPPPPLPTAVGRRRWRPAVGFVAQTPPRARSWVLLGAIADSMVAGGQ
jgi:hypothetical protein